MIAAVFFGFGLLAVIAVLVGIEEALHAPRRRMLAAERRQIWEARRRSADESADNDDQEDED